MCFVGVHVPSNRKPAADEKKLYLHIEGREHSAVVNAKDELKRACEEAALSLRPDNMKTVGKYTL